MTIGKYIPNKTIIHSIDPRVKIFANVLFIVLVFLSKSFYFQEFYFYQY
jgi:energy-coupling factor transporter transmembrane protein EcfT